MSLDQVSADDTSGNSSLSTFLWQPGEIDAAEVSQLDQLEGSTPAMAAASTVRSPLQFSFPDKL